MVRDDTRGFKDGGKRTLNMDRLKVGITEVGDQDHCAPNRLYEYHQERTLLRNTIKPNGERAPQLWVVQIHLLGLKSNKNGPGSRKSMAFEAPNILVR